MNIYQMIISLRAANTIDAETERGLIVGLKEYTELIKSQAISEQSISTELNKVEVPVIVEKKVTEFTTLNIKELTKLATVEAIKKHKSTKAAAKELGISERQLFRYKSFHNI